MATVVVSFSGGFLTASALAFALFSLMKLDARPQLKNVTDITFHRPEEEFHKGETDSNVNISQQVRVLCMVLIKSDDQNKAKHIKSTWGKRCNELIFFGKQEDPTLPAIPFNSDGSLDSWIVTKKSFEHVYRNKSLSNIDWILKADDETYAVVENLRYMLKKYEHSEPIYVDDIIELESNETVKLVKSGYVISKTALEKLIKDESKCQPFGNEMEDYYLNRCLEKLGLKEVNSKDCLGRLRFLPLGLGDIFMPYSTSKWTSFYHSDLKKKPSLYSCCSDFAVLFHSVTDYEMYVLEYLIYHLTPHGVVPNTTANFNTCAGSVQQLKPIKPAS